MRPPPELDPALPALPLAFEVEAIAGEFEAIYRRSDPRPVAVSVGRRRDTRYEPGTRCVVTYEISASLAGEAPRQMVGVVEVTPSGAVHRLYYDDPKLPQLSTAVAPGEMLPRLSAVAAHLQGSDSFEACEITPLRYKPGRSCVLRYRLRTPHGGLALIGKVLAAEGDALASTVTALHEASRAAPQMPRIPRPLGYWPDLQLLIQPAVEGGAELGARAFDTAARVDVREGWIRAAGTGLAALHSCLEPAGPRRTVEDDLRELRGYRRPVAALAPDLAGSFDRAVGEITRSASRLSETPPVASHGAFRTDQVIVDADGLVLIDLDGFCWASPARDIGNLFAYLDWKAIRQPQHAAFAARARRAFLDGYASVRQPPGEASLSLYRAVSTLRIAGRRYRSLSFEEWPLVRSLIDAAGA